MLKLFNRYRYTIMFCVAFLAACAKPIPVSALPTLSPQQVLWFQVEQLDAQNHVLQTSLLSVQADGEGRSRWAQTDVFGVPQARLILSAQGWERDGFAPPHSLSKQLFMAILPRLSDDFRQPEILQSEANRWRVQAIESPLSDSESE